MRKFFALLLALAMVGSLVGITRSASAEEALEPVTLKIWFHGSTVTPDASQTVLKEVNAYLQEKLNVTLEVIWGTWGDFDEKAVDALGAYGGRLLIHQPNYSMFNRWIEDGLQDTLDQNGQELLSKWRCWSYYKLKYKDVS